MAVVEIRDLTFGYRPDALVLRNVSLTIASGRRVAIVGPNGAGKSTLLWHLNGLLPETAVTESCISIDALSVMKGNLPSIRRQVGLLFQNPDDQLFCPTVGEDVAFGIRGDGTPSEIAARTATALDAVGLHGFEERAPGELSLGEKKRACLAGLLASKPSVLALDEPTASLDPRSRRGVVTLLESLPQTMVIATHDLALARELCHRVVILDEGLICADGDAAQILGDLELLRRHGLYA